MLSYKARQQDTPQTYTVNYRILKGLENNGTKATFKLEYPDGTAHQFDAIPGVKMDAGTLNGALTFSTTMILQSGLYRYGDPVSEPSSPTKEPDGHKHDTFAGWDKEVSASCTGEAVYTAVYAMHYRDFLVSGAVTSFGAADDEVTVRLLRDGAEVVSAVSTDGTYHLMAPEPRMFLWI